MILAGTILLLVSLPLIPSCTKEKLEQHRNFDRTEMLDNIANNVILPNHQQFADKTSELNEALLAFTTTPNFGKLNTAQEKWKAAMDAWKLCELFDLGAVKNSYLHNKIDAEANPTFILNHIYDTTYIDNGYIESAGSSSKGLQAIEFLIFNEANDNQALLDSFMTSTHALRFREYTKNLGYNLKQKADELYEVWDVNGNNYITEFIESQGSDLGSSISMLANEMITLIEKMVQTRLGKPLGKQSDGLPHPELVESLQSGHSLENLKNNLHSLEMAFEGLTQDDMDKIGLDDYLDVLKARYNDEALPDVVKGQFMAAHAALDAIDQPLNEAVVNDYATVDAAYTELRELLILLKVDVANNLAITVTFNDNDGD